MSDANFASLSSTLLARKGGAKPAMRPQSGLQGPVDGAEAAASLEDLGWNDMGDDEQRSDLPGLPSVPAAKDRSADKVVSLTPQAAHERGPVNEVKRSIDRIAAKLDQPLRSAAPAPAPAGQVRRPALSQGKRAAFTLRLDQERHLKLRLACTVRNRSAQQLVTDALDALLEDMPEIATLAAQVQRNDH